MGLKSATGLSLIHPIETRRLGCLTGFQKWWNYIIVRNATNTVELIKSRASEIRLRISSSWYEVIFRMPRKYLTNNRSKWMKILDSLCHSCFGQAKDTEWRKNEANPSEWMCTRTCKKCNRTWLGFTEDKKKGEVKWFVYVASETLKKVLGLSDGEFKGH